MASGISRLKTAAALTLLCAAAVALLAGCGNGAAPAERVTVPDLAGRSAAEAGPLLEAAGLALGDTGESFADDVAPGLIVSSSPPGGEEIERGGAVDVVVSRGPEAVTVPPLVGAAEADAAAALQGLGLQVEVKRIFSEDVAVGVVCATCPAADSAVARGSSVLVTVSAGSAYAACPACGGRGTVSGTVTCPDCGGTGFCDT